MPVMDGNEAAHRLRQKPGGESLRIVAMTAVAVSGDRETFLAASMNDSISEPLTRDALQAVVKTLVGDSEDPMAYWQEVLSLLDALEEYSTKCGGKSCEEHCKDEGMPWIH